MKMGDLVELPQNEGYAVVYQVDLSRPGVPDHPYSTAVVVRDWGLDYWDADACVIINSENK